MSIRLTSDNCVITVATGEDRERGLRVNIVAREAVIHIYGRRAAYDVGCSLLAWSFAADDKRVGELADRFRCLLAELEDIK